MFHMGPTLSVPYGSGRYAITSKMYAVPVNFGPPLGSGLIQFCNSNAGGNALP